MQTKEPGSFGFGAIKIQHEESDMNPGLRLHVGQQIAMTPQLLQSIRMLQLSSLELEQELREALELNPMLEQDDEAEAPIEEAASTPEDAIESDVPVTVADATALEQVQGDYDWSSSESWSGGEPADAENPIEERTAAPESDDIRVRALEQLRMSLKTKRDMYIAVAIVECVDDNGYLEMSVSDIAAKLEHMDVSDREVAAVLTQVQSVEPSGFAARDLKECLSLQLDDLPRGTPGLKFARQIVDGALEHLAAQDYDAIKTLLDINDAALTSAVNLVLALNPKPGSTVTTTARAVIPDVIVHGRPGNWKIELNPENLPRVRVNSLYEKLLANTSSHRGLREHLQEARWLVRGLEMRNITLMKTARAIFDHQAGFLVKGEEGMMPLTLREVAETIQMHESTVCRVTTNKYVQTPWGIYELKDFFPSQINGAEMETSGTAVKAMIRRIIDGESRAAPLCDGAIAATLHRKGVRVARRTVAKYREAMKIASAKERRAPVPRKGLQLHVQVA